MRATNIQIYKEYLSVRGKGAMTIDQLAKKHGMTKRALYNIVNKIEKGDLKKLQKCTEASRMECLWEYKYKQRYSAIPKGRNGESVKQLKLLIREMWAESFTLPMIAKFLKKDRTTILHHLTTRFDVLLKRNMKKPKFRRAFGQEIKKLNKK